RRGECRGLCGGRCLRRTRRGQARAADLQGMGGPTADRGLRDHLAGNTPGRPGHQAGGVRHAWGAGVLCLRSLGEYLQPPLQGYRLQEGEYQRLSPGCAGELVSQVLALELRLEEGRLRVINPATGDRLLTPAEAQAARRVAEAELGRLRAELARLR